MLKNNKGGRNKSAFVFFSWFFCIEYIILTYLRCNYYFFHLDLCIACSYFFCRILNIVLKSCLFLLLRERDYNKHFIIMVISIKLEIGWIWIFQSCCWVEVGRRVVYWTKLEWKHRNTLDLASPNTILSSTWFLSLNFISM